MAGGCLWFSPQLSPEWMNTHQLCGKRQRRWHNTVQGAEDTWDLQIIHKTGLAVLFTGCVTGVTQMYPVQTRTKGGCWWAAELPSACPPSCTSAAPAHALNLVFWASCLLWRCHSWSQPLQGQKVKQSTKLQMPMNAATPGSAPGIPCFQCHCQDTALGPAKITWFWS